MNQKQISLLLLALTLVFVGLISTLQYLPYQGSRPQKIIFEVKRGESLTSITNRAEQADILLSPLAFKWTSRLSGQSKSFKSGQYQLEGSISASGFMDMLIEGREILLSVTIPEGYRMTEIFQLLKRQGFQNRGEYLKWADNPKFVASLKLPVQTHTLEGFLYPETYFFPKEASERLILAKMVETFKQKVPIGYDKLARRVGLNYYQAMTLASIVEKETSKGFERPHISSVFHNRLKKGMKLQTDPTVIYGIKNYKGNIRRKHLKAYHPYNTYVISGLPPTPIANPGMQSLLAAVRPKATGDLFFVARGDGTHEFTTNFKDHRRAIRRYQLKRKGNYRSY